MICRHLLRRLLNSGRVNSRTVDRMANIIEADKKPYLGPQTRSKTKLYCTSTCVDQSLKEVKQNNSSFATNDMPYVVGHNKNEKEFYIKLQDDDGHVHKEKAVLQYDFLRPKFVDLYHTGVPPAFRGRGIAKLLAKAATEHFAAEGIMMRPSCTYIQKYVLETRIPRIWDLINWDDID